MLAELAAARLEFVALDAQGGSARSDATESTIRTLLAVERKALVHGECFTGRPSTWLYHDTRHILKIRSEFQFAAHDARRWIQQALNLEQRLAVHHPDKIWFLIHAGEMALIANLTPRLQPLHQLSGACDRDELCGYLQAVLAFYLRVASSHQKRLDEGLSNFALDTEGRLYYVDDDVYAWDEFTSFAQAIGFWFRALGRLTDAHAEKLGNCLRQLLLLHYQDPHTVLVVAGLVEGLHMANPEQERRRKVFLSGLNPPRHRSQVSNRLDNRRPIAVLADVHANLPALQAVLADMDQQGVKQALVLGDSVGYGPYPGACIQVLRQRNFTVLKGNHDHAIATDQYKHGFSPHAQVVAEWTRQQLDHDELTWLDTLPTHIRQDDWLAVHGSPSDKNYFLAYVYHMTYEANLGNLESRSIHISFTVTRI